MVEDANLKVVLLSFIFLMHVRILLGEDYKTFFLFKVRKLHVSFNLIEIKFEGLPGRGTT